MLKKILVVSLAIWSGSCAAEAYISGGYSATSLKPTISPAPTSTSHDSDDSSFFFDAGIFVTDNIAVEFGYRSAESKEQYNYPDVLAGDAEATIYKLGAKAFTSRASGIYGFGGLGLAMYELETTVTDGVSTLAVGTKLKEDTTNMYYTLGGGYRFDNDMALELSYGNYGNVSDAANQSNPAETKLTEMTLGLSIPF